MVPMNRVAVMALASLSGCFFDSSEPLPPLEGDYYQYVVSDLRVPTNNNEAREYGLDLNDDKTPDNQLGMIFGTLDSQGLGIADTAHEALLRGGLVMLAEIQTTSLDNADDAGLITYLGDDPVPNACLDENDLSTCGQHLMGTGQFTVDLDTASHQARGPIKNGVFSESTGIAPIEFAISLAGVIRVDLRGAKVKITQLSPDGGRGVIAGAIAPIDIDGVVIPEAAQQMDRIVSNECTGGPGSSGPCGCTARGKTLVELFDVDDNCRIEVDEVGENSLVRSLLAPDVRVHGQEMLSFGVGVDFARALF
jgi:hypothetical protein